ncbi:lipocalin family protein [Parapedobacter sp. ISTM3]|uniref:Outer membrane lipoprotein Blc n=1 Tax=Parapedobacter luteus TaxID=623280 RepID=A0A1T5DBE8_9SPHI|nr:MULTISPECIES: lipocalin family protein [Parapedobacter]MBK1438463.1 lipocalin family protein [Parapedobacter sp. ISTM3]SKB69118.1 apolipoprotein D and lipocalin family protein [Parapedobacter luteus]
MSKKNNIVVLVAVVLLYSCASIPPNAEPVQHFEMDRYLGNWYEIARLDHKQERDLNNVTATYSLNESGTIRVRNSGYNYVKGKWESATGKAKFRDDQRIGALKVSFFGPFYSGYNVIALDKDYQYALVAGESLKYLWILSRTTAVPDSIRESYLQKAEQIGYDTSQLIWVAHDREEPAH